MLYDNHDEMPFVMQNRQYHSTSTDDMGHINILQMPPGLISNAGSSEHKYQRQKQMYTVVFYLSIAYFQFQFLLSSLLLRMPD